MSRQEFTTQAQEFLLRERKALGLTQEELAEGAGVPRGSLARWERGLSEPAAHSLARLRGFVKARRKLDSALA